MFDALAQLPTLAIVAIFTLFFTVVMFGTRLLVRRRVAAERQAELVTLAEAMNAPTGVAMAFLIGFAVTITWGTINSAQTSVEKVAASAQDVAWLTHNLSDRDRAAAITKDLKDYLRAVSEEDVPRLAAGDVQELPSLVYLDRLEERVRGLAKHASASDPEADRVLAVASNIAEGHVELLSIARRQLPVSVLWLLLTAGTLSCIVMGIVATKVTRPFLLVGWALVSAMGISVVLSLYNPFAGDVTVNFQPLRDGVERILAP
ncbi:MAG: hypothetical protein U0R64_10840 [Candidatus Nanopelagicales bacterium]